MCQQNHLVEFGCYLVVCPSPLLQPPPKKHVTRWRARRWRIPDRRSLARIFLAVLFLVLAAVSTLVFPLALRNLIDGGLVDAPSGAALADGDKGAQVMALTQPSTPWQPGI